jgi:hypothetical protein
MSCNAWPTMNDGRVEAWPHQRSTASEGEDAYGQKVLGTVSWRQCIPSRLVLARWDAAGSIESLASDWALQKATVGILVRYVRGPYDLLFSHLGCCT